MEEEKPFPPGFTSYEDKFYEWAHDYLERHGGIIYNKMDISHIAETVEEAERDFKEAEEKLEAKQYELEQAKKYGFNDRLAKLESEVSARGITVLLMKIRMLNTQVAKLREKPERSTGRLEPRKPGQSSIFPKLRGVGRRLKTRRRNRRNGPSRLLRNGPSYLSPRKVKTRRA